MKVNCYISILVLLFFNAQAQIDVPEPGKAFDDTEVPKVFIALDEADLEKILYGDLESNEEYLADFIYATSYSRDTVFDVGLRLRGNTSRQKAKKSFKVAFNSFVTGQKWEGLEKMNLNGEANDPSLMRSKLGWDLFRFLEVPASRCNHIELYINQEYRGLYSNVEHIDEEFLEKRFASPYGNLYKCLWPADMHYKGMDAELYKEAFFGRQAYELKANPHQDDYEDLAHLIDVLNNYDGIDQLCELEQILNVDLLLRCMAADVYMGNWDGAFLNKNNFYLYKDPITGLFTFMPFDLDNTFGIDWFGIDWTRASIYNWSDLSGEARPLYESIIRIPEYRNRFSYYLDYIGDGFFSSGTVSTYLQNKLNLLDSSRRVDVFSDMDFGFGYDDFVVSATTGFGAHVPYGILEYLAERKSYIENNLNTISELPAVSFVHEELYSDSLHLEIKFVRETIINEAEFHYSFDSGSEQIVALDFTSASVNVSIPIGSNAQLLTYYVSLNYGPGLTRNFPFCRNATIPLITGSEHSLVINEFLSSNTESQQDESGEYEDWIEIYNAGGQRVDLSHYYLTDASSNPSKWRLPSEQLYPGEYLVLWADDNTEQGDYHTNFKLNREGEFLGLFALQRGGYFPLDTFSYNEQAPDRSSARWPNGIGEFKEADQLTFGTNNELPSVLFSLEDQEYFIFPNPVDFELRVNYSSEDYSIELFDLTGKRVFIEYSSPKVILVDNLLAGVYYIRLATRNKQIWQPFIKQ